MIGEIRDRETMQQALLHTLTGHLCLSTLHANNSYHALSRIINMFPYDARSGVLSDLSIGLRAIISQRLVRNRTASSSRPSRSCSTRRSSPISSRTARSRRSRRRWSNRSIPGRRRSSRRCAASTSTAQISYDEAMTASDSPTNLAWLINQNSPTSRVDSWRSATTIQPEQRRTAQRDFATMEIKPGMLDRALHAEAAAACRDAGRRRSAHLATIRRMAIPRA